jgi:hypothetical protein
MGLPCTTVVYQYDGAGNITAIGNDTFTYDGASRLSSANLVSVSKQQTYSYDAYGNVTNVGGSDPWPVVTASSVTNRLNPTTAASATTPDIAYDAAGNTTALAGVNYTYDAANTVIAVVGTGTDERYLYDADDERVATISPVYQNANGKTTTSATSYVATWRLRDLGQRVVREYKENAAKGTPQWSWTRDYLYRGALLLAEVQPPDTAGGSGKGLALPPRPPRHPTARDERRRRGDLRTPLLAVRTGDHGPCRRDAAVHRP